MRHLLDDGLTLATLTDGTRLELSLSAVSFHEGLWQIALIGADGVRLYSIGFGLTDEETLLMGNVQGPSPATCVVDDRARIASSDVTHASPTACRDRPHLLVHALRLLACQWKLRRVHGIDPENHVKGRWNLRDSRLRFDYRGFWTEQGATRESGGNWSLPLETTVRPLEEVPSKRRAMYRRRYAMFEALQQTIAALPEVGAETSTVAAAAA